MTGVVKMLVKEIGIGLTVSILIILFLQGINIFPVIFIGFLSFFMWQILKQKGINSVMKSEVKKISHVKFSDIGGQETAKKELIEALDFLKDVKDIRKMGIRPIKGILLNGPPGTGKTLMAKAAASYTDSVFKPTSGSEFIEMYAGLGAKRVRELFENARKTARNNNKNSAIVFIDEIDILGGKRGKVTSHLEYDQTLNQLLVEMDGLSVNDDIQVLVMATTNRIDILDPALLRPGRFDRIVQVDLPAKEGRLNILKIHTANKPLAEDVELDKIARETFQFSGAHLENLTNEAAIIALRNNENKIQQIHFMEAIDKVIMGEKLQRRPGNKELKRIAVHETGHALVSEVLNPGSVATITITSRGKALGYVRHNQKEDQYLQTEENLREKISIFIAGAVAEKVILKSRSTGATNDFQQAVKLVEKMVVSGMTELGVVNKDNVPADILHKEMSKILKKYEEEVKEIIQKHREIIIKIADKLIEHERFSGDELNNLLNNNDL